MSEDKITQIEIELSGIKVDVHALKSDINELRQHDARLERKLDEIISWVRTVGDKIISLDHRIGSGERKIGEHSAMQTDITRRLQEQNAAQMQILLELKATSVEKATQKELVGASRTWITFSIVIVGALSAAFNWIITHGVHK